MIERLIPKYPTFLILGLLITASGLLMLTAARDALIGVWADSFLDGETSSNTFENAQIADQVIGHILSVWLFLGLSFIKLGIGFAIATIIRNLRGTGQSMLSNFQSAQVPGADAAYQEPWFGRLYTRFLFAGILVVGFFFLVSLWWGANLVLLRQAEFDGETSGAAFNTYLIVERVLDPLIEGGKFLGEGLLIFGILMGLATIIWNLSFQARALPELARRALGGGNAGQDASLERPYIPRTLLKLGITGLVLIALATPLALANASFSGWALGRQFEGGMSETALRLEGIFDRTIDPLINMGLAVLFFTIAFLLLTIIRWLREQREGFGNAVADTSQGTINRPVIEPPLWPTKLVPPLAVLGLFVVGFFFFTMTGVRDLNFNSMLSLQFAGATDTSTFQSFLRFDSVIAPIIGSTRFVGVALLMTAIGLSLVTIVVNLQATALLLPSGFSSLIRSARGQRPESEDLTVYEPMSLAPWNLFRPLAAGAAIAISAALPVAILLGVSIHRMMGEQFAGRAEPGAMSELFQSSFLFTNLTGASWTAWMLFGMGIILFSIGRFFANIVGFVEARRMIIAEGTSGIAEALAEKQRTGAHA